MSGDNAQTSKYLENVDLGDTRAERVAAWCLTLENIDDVITCVENEEEGEWLNEEEGDDDAEVAARIDETYEVVLNVLRQGGYYTDVVQLLSMRATDYALGGDCAEASKIFRETDVTDFGKMNEAVFYGAAIGVMEVCQSPDLMEEYTQKRNVAMEEADDAFYF